MSRYVAALCLKACLAGLSCVEAQGSAASLGWGTQIRWRTPPVLPVDFAPSINWPESNAHSRTSRNLAIRQTCS